jgi:membrane protein implicated in regulation of membrane protease activity
MSQPEDAAGAPLSRVLLRYTAFQLPGLAIMVLGAAVATRWFEVPEWIALCAIGLWMLKDAVMFPFVRKAYEPGDGSHPRELAGAAGTAKDTLAPTGYVQISSELWRAECGPAHAPIEVGARIRVVEVRGLTVVVEPHPDDQN